MNATLAMINLQRLGRSVQANIFNYPDLCSRIGKWFQHLPGDSQTQIMELFQYSMDEDDAALISAVIDESVCTTHDKLRIKCGCV